MSSHDSSGRRYGTGAVVALCALLATAPSTLAGTSELAQPSAPSVSFAVPVAERDRVTQPPGVGEFSQHCNMSHTAEDDPILYPGQPGAAHEHNFFGNRFTDASSTPASLRISSVPDSSTCNREENRSAYWSPTLSLWDPVAQEFVYEEASNTRVYYRVFGIDQEYAEIEPFPANFGMIAGDATSHAAQGPEYVRWNCVNDGPEDPPEDRIPADCHDDSEETQYTGELRMRILFPNCWDGQTEPWAPGGKAHMAYAWQDENGDPEDPNDPTTPDHEPEERCPTTHPVPVPQVTIGVRWDIGTALNKLVGAKLISDRHEGVTGGFTAHADFMNGWDQQLLTGLVQDCVNAEVHCADSYYPPCYLTVPPSCIAPAPTARAATRSD